MPIRAATPGPRIEVSWPRSRGGRALSHAATPNDDAANRATATALAIR
jgi:hypothetical protein